MLIVLTGKTASGKDTLIKRILVKYPNFKKVLTTTSRTPRQDEVDGVDYNFIPRPEFKQKIDHGDFLEYVEYGGNFYGTEKPQINLAEDLIWKIDPSMAGKVKLVFPECIIIYIATDNETVLKRLKERGFSDEEINKRMQADQKFWDLYHASYDYVVENVPGKLDETIEKIVKIIEDKMSNETVTVDF
ncbi:hypothetical protein HYZ05_02120 [Candidatus Daviesbacteria bacterium]|nr:hypothetical protein [Candidatus Daviesbacteria bacterium]